MATLFKTLNVTPVTAPLYTLSLRSPDAASTIFNGMSYTFPISPQAIRKEVVSYNTVMDVASSDPSFAGVQRIVDQFGQSLPIYTLRGTTGWQRHSTDGYVWDGLDSIRRVQSMLTTYAQNNQNQIAQGKADQLYTLEFYDYFSTEFWEIVPIGPQGIDQSADRSLYSYYTFRFACVRDVSSAITALGVDLVADLLGADGLAAISLTTSAAGIYQSVSNTVGSAVTSVQGYVSNVVTDYL